VDLGTAGNFVILAKTAISNTPTSGVTGDLGLSPNTKAGITGFSFTMDVGNTFATSAQVTGNIYAADMIGPPATTPPMLTTAISDMQTAYTDAAGRTLPDYLNLGAGTIGGLTLYPGLYKWGTTVNVTTDITISGGLNDTWIFQVAGSLITASGAKIILSGGAQPKNIVWQVASGATLGSSSQFSGVILSQTAITLGTTATMLGRALAQTAVTLDGTNTVTKPPL
jgi:hypothetical protein